MSGMEPFLLGAAASAGTAATATTAATAATAATTGLLGAGGNFALGTALMNTGTILSTGGAITSGIQQKVAGDFQADQLEAKAGQERAVAQRAAEEKRRRAEIAMSRVQALSAASGGGATDPTVINIMSGIAGEGELAAQTDEYMGEERARTAETGAAVSRLEGSNAKTAGFIRGGATLLGGFGKTSLLDKYDPGGSPFSRRYGN